VTVQHSTPFTPGKFTELFFYGNYFYGFCAIAQAIEATLQLGFPLNDVTYYLLTFVATVFYYNYPYVRKYNAESTDSRTNWYRRNYSFVRWNQLGFGSILAVSLVFFLYLYHPLVVGIYFSYHRFDVLRPQFFFNQIQPQKSRLVKTFYHWLHLGRNDRCVSYLIL
jgi:hypothetical protein